MSGTRRVTLVVLLASLILTLSMGLRQSLGIFQPPMKGALGISAASFGLAMAIQSIVWGVSQPVIGMLGDRFGARPILLVSALIYSAGLALMSAGGSPASLDIGCGLIVGIGISGTGFGVLIGTVSRLVPQEKRSQTVGLVSALGSIGTLVLAPFGQTLISLFGWRFALAAFAVVAASMACLSIGIRGDQNPAEAAIRPAALEALKAAAAHRGFALMTLAFFACGFQLMFITAHLPQYLALCGLSPATGAEALGLIGLFNAIGSYAFGQLGARFSRRRLLSGIYVARTIIIIAYAGTPPTEVGTLLFAAAMGFLWLGVVPLVSSLISSLFGMGNFNTLFGLVFFSHQLGAFVGAWLGGLSLDLTGSYDIAWKSMIVTGLCAAALQWFMDERPGKTGQPV
jgi:predicted MFS family arabinose efflux permease